MSLLDEIALSDDALEAWLAVKVNRRPLVRFATKANGNIDPRPWCHGFYAAMQLNKKDWKPLLDLGNVNHGLLLPILIYCVDKKGNPVLGKPRPGPETAHFIEHEAYLDIALVIPALKELNNESRYGNS